MTKILSHTSTQSLALPARNRVLSVLRSVRQLFEAMPDSWSHGLSPRLRYDLGELDINPDKQRGYRPGSGGQTEGREMMRRAF
jgi:hypothetical protein